MTLRAPRAGSPSEDMQSNVTTLATGARAQGRNKFVILAGADAKLTHAGRYYYYETTGQRFLVFVWFLLADCRDAQIF